MEAAAAFNASVSIIQLVDFSCKVISTAHELYKTTSGHLIQHEELRRTTESLKTLTEKVNDALTSKKISRKLTELEEEQIRLGRDCARVASELTEALDRIRRRNKHDKWETIRQALQTVWRKAEIDGLEGRLDRFRQELIANTLAVLRQELQSTHDTQRDILEGVEEIKKNTLSIGQMFLRQIERNSRGRWERALTNAIRQNEWQSQRSSALTRANPLDGSALGAERRSRIEMTILGRLRFAEYQDREESIAKAHEQTFEWIFQDTQSLQSRRAGFAQWLAQDTPIFWITGKPGSGKSTLMKYLHRDPRTIQFLRKRPTARVIKAGFFLWNSGSDMQMSMMGLLQSLLYQLLSQLPDSIPALFPERWEVHEIFGSDEHPWSWQELSSALRRLILEVNKDDDFFLIIDGLDEFDGDLQRLIDLVIDLASSATNLKICTASRPWVEFEEGFRGKPSLTMQDVTHTDIRLYVNSKFNANAGFIELQKLEPNYATALLKKICIKSDGVFLWVHLVVMSLLSGLTKGDRLSDLDRRLDELPTDLKALFDKMLIGLDPFYRKHAAQLFMLFRASEVAPTLLTMAIADEDDQELVYTRPVAPFEDREMLSICQRMKRRLNSRCKGFLEVAAPNDSDDDDEPDFWSGRHDQRRHGQRRHGQRRQTKLPGKDMAELKVRYLHRTVKDYLHTSSVWKRIVDDSEGFHPYQKLCHSFLRQLKGLRWTHSLTNDNVKFWETILWCMEYAAQEEVNPGEGQVRLLDELDRAAIALTTQPYSKRSSFLQVSGLDDPNLHWTMTRLTWASNTSFLYLAAMCNLHKYLDMKLRHHCLREVEQTSTPLLVAAVSDYAALSGFSDHQLCSSPSPRHETVELLLAKGSNPDQRYHGQSLLSMAQNMSERDARTEAPQWAATIQILKKSSRQSQRVKISRKAGQNRHSKASLSGFFGDFRAAFRRKIEVFGVKSSQRNSHGQHSLFHLKNDHDHNDIPSDLRAQWGSVATLPIGK